MRNFYGGIIFVEYKTIWRWREEVLASSLVYASEVLEL
jgi:hypothetical protein